MSSTDKKVPGVSIFIIAYLATEERGKLLRTICENALEQNYSEFEVVVSDNAGPVPVEVALNGINDDRIRIFRNEKNLGFAGNFNTCLERCRYDIIKLNCDDDLLHPDFLRLTVPLVNDETFIVVDYEKYVIGDTPSGLRRPISGNPEIRHRPPGYGTKFWKPDFISLPGCTLFTRKQFEELGGYNKASILPDWDMMVEAMLRKNLVHVIQILCWMGVWDDSITVKSLAEKPYFFQRGWLFTKFRLLRHEKLDFGERIRLRWHLTWQFVWQSVRVICHLNKRKYRTNYSTYAGTYFRYLFNPGQAIKEYTTAKEW